MNVGTYLEWEAGGSDGFNRAYVQHTLSQATDASAVGFELGDDDVDDYFVVEVLEDPVYKTLFFNTLSGVSKCVHESNTASRSRPGLELLEAPFTAVNPDQAAIFMVQLSNSADTGVDDDDSSLVLELDTQSVESGLRVVVGGRALGGGKTFYNFPGVGRQDITVEVKRGPLEFVYAAPRLRVRQWCGGDREFGEVSQWVDLATDAASNLIEFVRPCSKVEWSGAFLAEASFLVNSASAAQDTNPSSVYVTGKNPNFNLRRWKAPCEAFESQDCPEERCQVVSDSCDGGGASWHYDERLQWVRVQYRLQGAKGADAWQFALAPDGQYLELREAETQYGGASGFWRAPNIDGTYEIRLKAQCSASAGPEYDESLSSIITGVVDRVPPRLFRRLNEPADGVFSPGDTISAVFSERINCGPDNGEFAVSMEVNSSSGLRMFSHAAGTLLIACEERLLSVSLPPAADFATIVGSSITVRATGISDMAGNFMDDPVEWGFKALSSCSADAHNAERVQPQLRVVPISQAAVQPDQPALFIVEVRKPADAGRDIGGVLLEFDVQSIEHGLQLSVGGAPITDGKLFRNFPVAENFDLHVEVRRGPLEYSYAAVRLRAHHHCGELDPEAPAWEEDQLGAVSSYVELATHASEKRIRFLRPCSSVAWSGELLQEGSFLVNAAGTGLPQPNTVRVMAKNPTVSQRRWKASCNTYQASSCPAGSWSYDERLQWVRLQYRMQGARGASAWQFAKQPNGSLVELREEESLIGIAEALWQVPDQDGVYEIRLKAQCSSAEGEEYDKSTSSVLVGVVDRKAPVLLNSATEPADGVFSPGDVISASFSEDIDCGPSNPYLTATMVIGTQSQQLVQETMRSVADGTLTIVCSERVVYLQLAGSMEWSSVVGSSIQVQLSGVADFAGNVIDEPAEWSFTIPDVTGTVAVGITMDYPVFASVDDVEAFKSAARNQLAKALSVTAEAFEVAEVRAPSVGTGIAFDIVVRAAGTKTAVQLADEVVKYVEGMAGAERRLTPCSGEVFCGSHGKPKIDFETDSAESPMSPSPPASGAGESLGTSYDQGNELLVHIRALLVMMVLFLVIILAFLLIGCRMAVQMKRSLAALRVQVEKVEQSQLEVAEGPPPERNPSNLGETSKCMLQ